MNQRLDRAAHHSSRPREFVRGHLTSEDNLFSRVDRARRHASV